MEQAIEKVMTTPQMFYEKYIDMTRKKTSIPKTCDQKADGSTAEPGSSARIRDDQPHAATAAPAKGRDGHDKEHHRHRHKHRHRERRKRQEERRARSHKHGHESATSKPRTPEAVHLAVAGLGEADPDFFEDRKGDQYNVTYGSLHRYSIPRYRTAGYGRVIGLGRRHKILQVSDGHARILNEDPRDSDVRVKAYSLLTGNVDEKTPPVRVLPDALAIQTKDAELQRDFLALQTHGSRKRRRIEVQEAFHVAAHDRSPASQPQRAECNPLAQAQTQSESNSDDSDSASSSHSSQQDSFDQFRKDARQQKTLELSRAVHDHPQDIDAWLALIKHQGVSFDR